MLRMNKDHRSPGLRWSLPLSGGSFGNHESLLGGLLHLLCGLLCKTLAGWALRSFNHGGLCCRRCCGRRFCERVYRDRWSMRKTSFLLQLWGLEIRCSLWERALLLSFSSFLVSAGAAADGLVMESAVDHLRLFWHFSAASTISGIVPPPPSEFQCAHCRQSEMKKPVKGSSEDEDAFRIRLVEWDSNNHQILTWLRNTSIPSISNLLGNFDDARTAWDMLAKQYSSSHGTREYQLSIEQYRIRQDPGQSITDFFARFQFIWDQLDLVDPPWGTPNDAMKYATHVVIKCVSTNFLWPCMMIMSLSVQSDSDQSSPNTRRSDRKSNKFCDIARSMATLLRLVIATIEALLPLLMVIPTRHPLLLLLLHTLDPPLHSPQINWKTSSLRLSSELVMHPLPLLFLSCLDPRTGQELGTGRRIGRLFEISSLRLPATSVSAATSS
uniref:Retrotransposon gag domain-containing protein n=1 Tax=Fagus sylvatica TaxID=28930 RepID=A0A2N9EPD4_FAGSY